MTILASQLAAGVSPEFMRINTQCHHVIPNLQFCSPTCNQVFSTCDVSHMINVPGSPPFS